MFSLILSLVGIALVAVLALATLWYGGTAFKDNNVRAEAARVVLEGQQISAAVELYRSNNNALPESIETLTADGKYLTSTPNTEWTFSTEYVVYPMTDLEACKKANAALNLELQEVPMCSAVEGRTICCQKDDPAE